MMRADQKSSRVGWLFAQGTEMFDDAARASKANPPFRADGANAHVIWRIENADDPGRDVQ